jgi:prepilin-type N-terminal cleavage/methylation domain-containing protein
MLRKNKSGFTLIELLIVMAIIAVLVTLAILSYRTIQMRGRDAQRKANLNQLSKALEVFYADHGFYPSWDGNGHMQSCPYTTFGTCVWGSSQFNDSSTIYFALLPKDPISTQYYYYRNVTNSSGQKYQIFAALENPKDPNCLTSSCDSNPIGVSCGTKTCNFAVTSPNTTASEY